MANEIIGIILLLHLLSHYKAVTLFFICSMVHMTTINHLKNTRFLFSPFILYFIKKKMQLST